MVSCAPIGNRRFTAHSPASGAGYQPGAGCQPALHFGGIRHCILRDSISLFDWSTLGPANPPIQGLPHCFIPVAQTHSRRGPRK